MRFPSLYMFFAVALYLTVPAGNAVCGEPYTFSIDTASYVYYKAPIRLLFVSNPTITGTNRELSGTVRWPESGAGSAFEVVLKIDARGFETGNRTRDNDVRKILDAENHPSIEFILEDVIGLTEFRSGEAEASFIAAGKLTVKGIAVDVTVPVTMAMLDGALIIDGSFGAAYSDFGIDPPRVAGFVGRAPDEIRLGIHLVARRTNDIDK